MRARGTEGTVHAGPGATANVRGRSVGLSRGARTRQATTPSAVAAVLRLMNDETRDEPEDFVIVELISVAGCQTTIGNTSVGIRKRWCRRIKWETLDILRPPARQGHKCSWKKCAAGRDRTKMRQGNTGPVQATLEGQKRSKSGGRRVGENCSWDGPAGEGRESKNALVVIVWTGEAGRVRVGGPVADPAQRRDLCTWAVA